MEEQAHQSQKEEERKLKQQTEAKRRAIYELSLPINQKNKRSVLSRRDLPHLPSNNPGTPLDCFS